MSIEITRDQKDWLSELNNQILQPNSKPEDSAELLAEIKFHKLLDYSDKEIDTPLIIAVMMGRKDWVLALLRMGAKIDVKNNQSQSLFDVLNKHNDPILKTAMTDLLKSSEEMVAFNMSRHPRLGEESSAKILPQDVVSLIAKHLKDGRENDGR
ncbi:MAG: hypothetical protein V4612_03130 [Pseudomonadota bacterium]